MSALQQKKFYITTAIDYPNGRPHMGHALEKVVSDCYARWYQFKGHQSKLLTGTDENGQKLIESAKKENLETQTFVDQNVMVFKELCQKLNIHYSDFIRTTEKRHAEKCVEFWNKLSLSGDIYFGVYSGNYCLQCESFYTETQAPDGTCPAHHTQLTKKEEAGYFLKLSKYRDFILDHFKAHPDFIVPRSSYNEMLSRLESEELRDLPISRPNEGWGIVVPTPKGHEHEQKFVMYTWFDALINYYSALNKDDEARFWPADVHVIGKDIAWFHTIIWPIMLKGMNLALPKQVYVHGMILAEDGKKMSKSLGNVIDPFTMLEKYPLDSFRYYLLRAIPAQSDGKFSEKELVDKHNAELGNSFGNLIMRVIKLYLKNNDPAVDATDVTQDVFFQEYYEKMSAHMDAREHNKALEVLLESINSMNQYVNTKEPWKLKENKRELKQVVYNCLYSIHAIALLMTAFLPDTATNALIPLGKKLHSFETFIFGESYQLSDPTPLFPKIDPPAPV